MVWQRTGTVAVQTGSTTVIGTNVDFAASSRNGDSFVGPDGATYELSNVASSTVISILPAYKGPTVSGAAYAIMPVQGYDKMLSDAFNNLNNQFGQKLAALGTTGNYDVLPISKGGTGRTSIGNVITADVVTGPSDTTAGRVLVVGSGGVGAKDNASYLGTNLNPDNYRTGGLSYWGQFVILGVASNGFLTVLPGNDANWAAQQFINVTTGAVLSRVQASGAGWSAWTPSAKAGVNSDINRLAGLTTAITVAQGGTGASTAPAARAALGLGSASTLTAGSGPGNVMLAGDINSPLASTINTYGNSFQIWSSDTVGAPETSAAGTMINAAYYQNPYGSQILMSFTGRIYFRSGSYATAAMREIYHTGNTTRAADGTLKAI